MLEFLQIYWWVVVSLLGGIFVFMMFVQGGQTLILGRDELEKDLIINSIGRKWELTFTTLVMFGGACFAAFPLFYATSFGGAYWVWMAILFCFIIQAVAYEYRKKPDNLLGAKGYELFLVINGIFGTILIGIAVSTFFSGSEFELSSNNFVEWKSEFRGLEALKNPLNLALGIALFFQARVGASLYLINNIDDEKLRGEFRASLARNFVQFLIFVVIFLAWIMLKDGYHISQDGVIVMREYKYFMNFMQMPFVLMIFLFGLCLVIFGVYKGVFTSSIRGIFPYGVGIVMVVFALFLIVGLNNTAFYPSYFNIQNSLTIYNASSSLYTLKMMAYVSLFVPAVLGYIAYVWRLMDGKKLTKDEIKDDEHIY